MNCLECGRKMYRNGYTKSGTQRYRCKCKKTRTGGVRGRPTLSDRPLTNAEMVQRYKAKKRAE